MVSDTPSSPHNTTATDKVLATTELLAHILSFLPPTQLLLANRVSTTFRATIASAPHLQHALFLRPNHALWSQPASFTPNPLLAGLRAGLPDLQLTFVNPNAAEGDDDASSYCLTGPSIVLRLRGIPTPGSCARMYITQPPIGSVDIFSHAFFADGQGNMHRDVQFVTSAWGGGFDGVTWGDVCKALGASSRAPLPLQEDARIAGVAAVVVADREEGDFAEGDMTEAEDGMLV